MKYYKSGLWNTGPYLVSGHPYMTGAASLYEREERLVEFPSITKKIVVINSGSNSILKIHFRPTGWDRVDVGNHFIQLDGDEESFEFNVKCKQIYISNPSTSATAAFQLYAECTGIDKDTMYELTGAGVTA